VDACASSQQLVQVFGDAAIFSHHAEITACTHPERRST
jgi:hypothetical protein